MTRSAFWLTAVAAILTAVPQWLRAGELASATPATDYSYCTLCHGATGGGNVAILAPALAGIEPWYLAEKLKSYREVHRGKDFAIDPAGTEMRTVAREVADDRVPGIARYITGFHLEPRPATVSGNAGNGKTLFASHCAACHGARAQGNALLHAPALTRLNDWYLVAAFGKYRTGIRGAAIEDTWANQMHLNTQALPTDFPIKDVSSYLNKLHADQLHREPRPLINR